MKKANFLLVTIALAFSLPAQQCRAQAQDLPKTGMKSQNVVVLDLPVQNIGTLEKINEGVDYTKEHSPGTTFANLSGRVSIPANTVLGVTVRDSLSDPTPVLERIPAGLVQSLTLIGLADFSDRTIKSILRFKNIKRLQLNDSEVDDAGLARFAALTNLESLVVSHTQIKGTTFSSLCALKKLTRLDIGSNEIKGEALPAFTCLKHLDNLAIGRCHLRNPHLAFLADMPTLRQLDINDNHLLSDPCMKYIARLHNLTELKLDGTHISAKGILMLKGAPLKHVRVSSSMLTDADKLEVEKVFPHIRVKVNKNQARNFGIFKELFERR